MHLPVPKGRHGSSDVSSWAFDPAERSDEVIGGLVGAYSVADRLAVHQEAMNGCEHNDGQLGSAKAACVVLEGCKPIGGRLSSKAEPGRFSCEFVQADESAERGLALRPRVLRPRAAQGTYLWFVRPQASQVEEGLAPTLPRRLEDLAGESVTGSEVVDQHPARRACGDRQGREQGRKTSPTDARPHPACRQNDLRD
jgi:hypothetical protein